MRRGRNRCEEGDRIGLRGKASKRGRKVTGLLFEPTPSLFRSPGFWPLLAQNRLPMSKSILLVRCGCTTRAVNIQNLTFIGS